MFHPHRFLPLCFAASQRKFVLQTGGQNFSPRNLSARFLSNQSFNQLDSLSGLRNTYYALRHGQSKANVAGIIASDPKIATVRYGLSCAGVAQALTAGEDIVSEYNRHGFDGLLVLSSDFLRAIETAEYATKAVKISKINMVTHDILIDKRLRERFFGSWDGGSDEHYNDVWVDDAKDASHTTEGVESVQSVLQRTTEMCLEWDAKYENHMIICVAHGDVLQILQSGFSRLDCSLHRSLEHLETATLRKLVFKDKL